MNVDEDNSEIDGYYCPQTKCRWKTYFNYKVILWTWMMNEITMLFTPTEVSHNGFYAPIFMQAMTVIFIAMPLAYSEICLGQYTNCNLFTVWDYFPLFRNVGYASYYLIFIKSIYLLVLSSWYLIYTFYAAIGTPPWFNCNEFGDNKCMVKRINVSIFQHCLEAQFLFGDDCGMKTASNFFFEREIGNNSTLKNAHCFLPWKTIISVSLLCILAYILSIRKEKIIQIVAKMYAVYVCLALLALFCIALSANGTWYATKLNVEWTGFTYYSCFNNISRGFLSVGTGSGILIYLSRDVSFRSPATMTAISTCLFSLFVSFVFSLIAFSGIRTTSYYHGEEENVIELGSSLFFPIFASMSEIMIYFEPICIWSFVWFSVGCFSLFMNFWILYLVLRESLLNNCYFARRYPTSSSMVLIIFIALCTLPFLCSDLTGILTDATEIMQTFNSLLLSVSLYWIYGIYKHNVDIIFMIGIKASYLLKFTWLINPVALTAILCRSWDILQVHDLEESYYINSLGFSIDLLVLYIIIGIYGLIIIAGILVQIVVFCRRRNVRGLLWPNQNWGPKNKILSRSRNMFIPEIMTREFLYRQVRIRGYQKKRKSTKLKVERKSGELSVGEMAWSALTSN